MPEILKLMMTHRILKMTDRIDNSCQKTPLLQIICTTYTLTSQLIYSTYRIYVHRSNPYMVKSDICCQFSVGPICYLVTL